MSPHRPSLDPVSPELVEWLVVTLILTIAFFAILQVVGDDLRQITATVENAIRTFFSR